MMSSTRSNQQVSIQYPNWAIFYRVAVFGLALGFWIYYVGRHPFDATGGWRYLTNWGHSFNLLALTWALSSHKVPALQTRNPILSTALTMGTIVVILYWSLYIIDPALVNGANPLPWYSEWYMHLGSTVTVYIEALLLNKAPSQPKRALVPLGLVATCYISWIEWVVPNYNNRPCGLTTNVCGYPYPFLNDLSVTSRYGLYLGAFIAMVFLCAVIIKLWGRATTR
jgi:hypothetical protein